MQDKTTLYKIKRDTAAGGWINVETNPCAVSTQPHLLFCGGFHSNMRGDKANFLANLAIQNRWGFTRFDYLGHGTSDGAAEYCSLHDWLGDVLAVIDSLPNRVLLIGSSMGAWLATHAALLRHEKVQALVTIAAAPDFTENLLWPSLSPQQQQAVREGNCVCVPTHYDGEDWRVRDRLFESGRDLALLNNTQALDISVPIRMMHGTADLDVPWSLSQQLLDRCTHSKNATLRLISGGDHRLSDNLGLNQLQCMLMELVAHNQDSWYRLNPDC